MSIALTALSGRLNAALLDLPAMTSHKDSLNQRADFLLFYRALEPHLRRLARSRGMGTANVPPDVDIAPILDIVEFLMEDRVLDEEDAQAFLRVLDARNRIVHGTPARPRLEQGIESARLLAQRIGL
jgi:hypothetical protein